MFWHSGADATTLLPSDAQIDVMLDRADQKHLLLQQQQSTVVVGVVPMTSSSSATSTSSVESTDSASSLSNASAVTMTTAPSNDALATATTTIVTELLSSMSTMATHAVDVLSTSATMAADDSDDTLSLSRSASDVSTTTSIATPSPVASSSSPLTSTTSEVDAAMLQHDDGTSSTTMSLGQLMTHGAGMRARSSRALACFVALLIFVAEVLRRLLRSTNESDRQYAFLLRSVFDRQNRRDLSISRLVRRIFIDMARCGCLGCCAPRANRPCVKTHACVISLTTHSHVSFVVSPTTVISDV